MLLKEPNTAAAESTNRIRKVPMMNKKLKSLAFVAIFSPAPLFGLSVHELAEEPIEVQSSFGYESEYVFRGVKQLGHNLNPGVRFDWLGSYGEIRTVFDGSDNDFTEVDYTLGHTHQQDALSIDGGITFYTFPENRPELRRAADDTYEVFLGTAYDLAQTGLRPNVYFFYDFELEDFTIQVGLDYLVDLHERLGAEAGIDVGHLFADNSDDDRFYYQAKLDLVYQINPVTHGRVGGRVAGNDNSIDPDPTVWWGASVAVAF